MAAGEVARGEALGAAWREPKAPAEAAEGRREPCARRVEAKKGPGEAVPGAPGLAGEGN